MAEASPPPAALPAFEFSGGRSVETTADPHLLYKGFVEYTLRSRWQRPPGIADRYYVAEAEVAIDSSGRLLGAAWKRGSGDPLWDESARRALAQTTAIGRPPPRGFPEKVLVRFGVQEVEDIP